MNEISDDLKKLLKWASILGFFAVVPPVFLFFAGFIVGVVNVTGKPPARDFVTDLPLILLAYYGGVMGSILSYLYDRLNGQLSSQETIAVMSRFLFGGIIGSFSFFLIRSALILKLFYPKIDQAVITPDALSDYRPIVGFAVFCGIIGPTMIKGLRKRI